MINLYRYFLSITNTKMGEQFFGTFALGLDNISWVIVAGI